MRPPDATGTAAGGGGGGLVNGGAAPALAEGRLGSGGGGAISGGGGGGAEAESVAGGGGYDGEPPASKDDQPALRNAGAAEVKLEAEDEAGAHLPDAFGTSGGGGTEGSDPTVAHPDFLEPDWVSIAADAIGAEPDRFGAVEVMSTSMVSAAVWTVVTVEGLAILIPMALAIFLSSFSSRFLSFSFRLSTSSFGVIRAFACMSLKRAL